MDNHSNIKTLYGDDKPSIPQGAIINRPLWWDVALYLMIFKRK